jgi:hypothetical protein
LQNYVIADYVANVGSTWIQNILNQM